jgi:hypothetical protein
MALFVPGPHHQIHSDILGLKASNNGRSCSQHMPCGSHLAAGDFVVFRATTVLDELTDEPEPAIKVVRLLEDGTEGCTVGFLSRHIAADMHQSAAHVDRTAIVLELYEFSEIMAVKKKSWRGFGTASFSFVASVKDEAEEPKKEVIIEL